MKHTMNLRNRIERAHIQLIRNKDTAFLSGVLLIGEVHIIETDDLKTTARTDGFNRWYGSAFCDQLTDEELIFVVMHEAFHVMLRHFLVWKHLHKRNAQASNMAADFVINGMIDLLDPNRSVMALPRKSIIEICLDHKYDGWDTGQVFDDLMKNPPPDKEEGGEGEGGGGKPGEAGDGDGTPQPMDTHEWGKADAWSEEEAKAIEQAVDMAVRQGGLLAGKMGGQGPRDLGLLPEPKVSWKEVLAEFVNNATAGHDESTWRRPNRRWAAQGIHMPATYSEAVGDMLVAIDTSGSIGQIQLSEFMAEVKAICKTVVPASLVLMYWDTSVAAIERYDKGNYDSIEAETKPAGGGGTSPQCIKDWVDEQTNKPEAVIVLTDGWVSSFPQFVEPALWVITSDVKATSGVSINI